MIKLITLLIATTSMLITIGSSAPVNVDKEVFGYEWGTSKGQFLAEAPTKLKGYKFEPSPQDIYNTTTTLSYRSEERDLNFTFTSGQLTSVFMNVSISFDDKILASTYSSQRSELLKLIEQQFESTEAVTISVNGGVSTGTKDKLTSTTVYVVIRNTKLLKEIVSKHGKVSPKLIKLIVEPFSK